MNDSNNRKRWAVDQRKWAGAAFAKKLAPVNEVRAERLADLRWMEKFMTEHFPHMTDLLTDVQSEIARLEAD